MKCAVFNCKSDNKCKKSEVSFYSFPKDKALLKKWVHFCHRKDVFNIKSARICMKHFTSDDVENQIQFEMGFCSKKTLKPGCIPSVNENTELSSISKKRLNRIHARNNKKLVDTLLKVSNQPDEFEEEFISSLQPDLDQSGEPLLVEKSEPCEDGDEEEFLLEDNTIIPAHQLPKIEEDTVQEKILIEHTVPEELQCHVQGEHVICPYVGKASIIKTDVDRLRREKLSLEQGEKKYIEEICVLKKRLEKLERDNNNLESNLRSIFTAGQVDKLKNGMKRKVWSDEEMDQALALYSTSKKAYKMLFRQNFPIPATRTIQKFLQTRNDSTKVIEECDAFSTEAVKLEEVEKEPQIPAIRTIQKYLHTRNDSTEVLEEYIDYDFSAEGIKLEEVENEHNFPSIRTIQKDLQTRNDSTEVLEQCIYDDFTAEAVKLEEIEKEHQIPSIRTIENDLQTRNDSTEVLEQCIYDDFTAEAVKLEEIEKEQQIPSIRTIEKDLQTRNDSTEVLEQSIYDDFTAEAVKLEEIEKEHQIPSIRTIQKDLQTRNDSTEVLEQCIYDDFKAEAVKLEEIEKEHQIPSIRTIEKDLQTRNDSTEVLEQSIYDDFTAEAVKLEQVEEEHSNLSSIELSRIDLPESIEKDNTLLLTPFC